MAKPKLPWSVRGGDFYTKDWHTRPTVGYQLMFEFIRLSPSYELARKYHAEGLSAAEKKNLPPDFDLVLTTYELFGDVQRILFRQWWIKIGIKVFGNPFAKPKVHKVVDLNGGQDITSDQIKSEINHYLQDIRRDQGLPGAVIVAIPLGLKKAEVKRQVEKILLQSTAQKQVVKKPVKQLEGQRLRPDVLFNGLRLLWFKAAKPQWEDWRLGVFAELSKPYAKVLDINAPRRTTNSLEADDRNIMARTTNRALKKYQFIAENAARGRFPVEDALHHADFDYSNLAKRIQRKNTWEKREKARLIELYQKRNALN